MHKAKVKIERELQHTNITALGSVFWEAYVQNVGAWEDLGDFLTLLWTAERI